MTRRPRATRTDDVRGAAGQHGVRGAERGGEGVHRARHPGSCSSGTDVGRQVSVALRVAAGPRSAREERPGCGGSGFAPVMKQLCGRRWPPGAGSVGVFLEPGGDRSWRTV